MANPSLTKPRTVISFDFGHVHIGVAVGQEITATASPLTTQIKRVESPDWDAISEIIAQWKPNLLVVGIPYHADGSVSTITAAALQFCRQLCSRFQLPVETIDERLSSWEADYRIANSKSGGRKLRQGRLPTDNVAAAVILETWFNRPKQHGNIAHATGC
jgi:putative Holliday junction resolvase